MDLAIAISQKSSKLTFDGRIAVIETLEGTMRAEIGDWIIRGVKGELYPCKPDIFTATYEPVDSSERPGLKADGTAVFHTDAVATEGCKVTTSTQPCCGK